MLRRLSANPSTILLAALVVTVAVSGIYGLTHWSTVVAPVLHFIASRF